MNVERNAKSATKPEAGFFAALLKPSRATGSGASRLSLIVPLALALATALLFGAASASAAEPTVTIENASNVKFTSAEVEGSVDPGEEPTTYRFQYATQADFSDAVDGIVEGLEGTGAQPVQGELTNLQPNTTYHLRLLAENGSGNDEAVAAETFKTKAVTAPELTIESASALTYHSAHVSGTVALANEDPAFNTSSCAFQYVTDAQFNALEGGGFENAVSQPCEPETVLGTETQPVEVKADLDGLAPGTTYHLRLVANNLGGNATAVAASFETEAVNPPSATALSVSAITATSAHFQATVNSGGTGPGEGTAVYSFSCEPQCPGLPGPEPIVADGSDHTVEATATGLEPNTPYTVTLIATSPGGESKAEGPFTTKTLAPDATTLPFVGPASSEAARLYGTVNPHNSETKYFFEYGPTAAYGSSVPVSKDAAAPPGNATETVSQDLTGLQPSTTYHYRVVAESPAGTMIMGQDRTLTTAEAPASCPNEALVGFNGFLPGCGAYERVSPAFKDGTALSPYAITGDGSAVVGLSVGLFAGVEGDGLDAANVFYKSVRTEAGWMTSALSPPSSLFPTQEFKDTSADLSRSLWKVREASQAIGAMELAVREPNGSFLKVGSMVPPAFAEAGPPAGEFQQFAYPLTVGYAGTSPDLSHVFFFIRGTGPLWPGDTTVNVSDVQSLYEYVGTENTQPPLRVGLDSEGNQITDCGTYLGSVEPPSTFEADTYNAVSTDGETVFFTAMACGGGPEVNEVYARIGYGPGAQTVAISEPSGADCATCQSAAKTAAEFQGASEDGSEAFFLTEQELFAGDTGKNLYEYDLDNPAGQKIVRVSTGSNTPEVQGVARVSEDGSHIYFVARGVLSEGPNGEGGEPVPGGENLYVFERDAAHSGGHIAFIATLSEADAADWRTEDRRPVQATPDGRFLAFQSRADLTPGDTSSAPQVFEYDAAREELVRVSVGQAGYAAGMESADAHPSRIGEKFYTGSESVHPKQSTTGLTISSDGAVVAFTSTAGLTVQTKATSEANRVSAYEYRSAGRLSNGDVSALSNGDSAFSVSLAGIDLSGGDAFVETATPVLSSDGDTEADLYDARAGGGFPVPPAAAECENEGDVGGSCQSAGGPPPALPRAKSDSVVPAPPSGTSRAQQLAGAVKACRRAHKPGHARHACEARAHRRYGSIKPKGRG
jgi:hypothetical protein